MVNIFKIRIFMGVLGSLADSDDQRDLEIYKKNVY